MRPDAERVLADMPHGLDRALIRILAQHKGKQNAIKKGVILNILGKMGIKATDRQVRKKIADLRKDGYLICSYASGDGGYYMATNLLEVDEFLHAEFESRVADLSETQRIMKHTARQQFGEGVQMGLL